MSSPARAASASAEDGRAERARQADARFARPEAVAEVAPRRADVDAKVGLEPIDRAQAAAEVLAAAQSR
jgi:hypothetical protein